MATLLHLSTEKIGYNLNAEVLTHDATQHKAGMLCFQDQEMWFGEHVGCVSKEGGRKDKVDSP